MKLSFPQLCGRAPRGAYRRLGDLRVSQAGTASLTILTALPGDPVVPPSPEVDSKGPIEGPLDAALARSRSRWLSSEKLVCFPDEDLLSYAQRLSGNGDRRDLHAEACTSIRNDVLTASPKNFLGVPCPGGASHRPQVAAEPTGSSRTGRRPCGPRHP